VGDLVDRAIDRQRIFGRELGVQRGHTVITREESHPTTSLRFFASAIGDVGFRGNDPFTEPKLQLRARMVLGVVNRRTLENTLELI
jgi:hypothetical protein